MIRFLRRLGAFWIVIAACIAGGYFAIFNLDYTYVELPHIGTFKVRAATAYLISFSLGATVVVIYFGLEVLRMSWDLRHKTKRIKELESLSNRYSPRTEQKTPTTSDTPSTQTPDLSI